MQHGVLRHDRQRRGAARDGSVRRRPGQGPVPHHRLRSDHGGEPASQRVVHDGARSPRGVSGGAYPVHRRWVAVRLELESRPDHLRARHAGIHRRHRPTTGNGDTFSALPRAASWHRNGGVCNRAGARTRSRAGAGGHHYRRAGLAVRFLRTAANRRHRISARHRIHAGRREKQGAPAFRLDRIRAALHFPVLPDVRNRQRAAGGVDLELHRGAVRRRWHCGRAFHSFPAATRRRAPRPHAFSQSPIRSRRERGVRVRGGQLFHNLCGSGLCPARAGVYADAGRLRPAAGESRRRMHGTFHGMALQSRVLAAPDHGRAGAVRDRGASASRY